MADENNLQIVFGAKVDGLVQGTKQGSAAIQEMVDNIREQTAALDGSSKATTATASSLRAVIPAATSASTGMATIEKAATSAGHGTAGFYRELLVLSHEMAMGNYSRFGGSMMVLAERSGKLTQIFGVLGTAVSSVYAPVVAVGVVMGIMAIKAVDAEVALTRLHAQMSFAGTAGLLTMEQFEKVVAQLEHFGYSSEQAEKATLAMATSTRASSASMKEASDILPDLAAGMGSLEAATKLAGLAIDDPARALEQLRSKLEETDPDLLKLIDKVLRTGDTAKATKLELDYLRDATNGLGEETMSPWRKAWDAVKETVDSVVKSYNAMTASRLPAGLMPAKQENYMQDATEKWGTSGAEDRWRNTNAAIAKGDELTTKLKVNTSELAGWQDKLVSAQNALNASKQRGDSARVAEQTQNIAEIQAKMAGIRQTAAKAENSQQLLNWTATLNTELEQQQIFGDKAKAFELKFWQDKKAAATKGSAEYNQINEKIYELESQRYEKGTESAKESERKKQEAAKQTLEQERQAAVAHFDQLAALYRGDEKKYIEIQNEKLKFLRGAYGQESKQAQDQEGKIAEVTRQGIEKQRQTWTGFLGSVKSSFNSSIMGMIQGTQTFGQAIGNIFLSIGESIFGVLEDIAAKWVITQIVGDTASASGARIGIASNAAVAGSAAFASTAAIPIVGPPAAPAAAAAAYAGAMSFESAVPGFAVGAWNLPSDMIAQVHKGEMIIPRTFADDLRSNGGSIGGGGGGGDTHVHINAIDAGSFQRMLKRNPDAIVGALRAAHRNGSTRGMGMTAQVFPALKGLDWDVGHDFDWSGNTVVESVSGKRTARANWSYPRHVFTLAYTFLRADPAIAEYQALAGFFNAMQGQFGVFLYQDATDNAVVGQAIGIGDGVTTTFQLVRAFGGFVEPCFAPNQVSKVYLGGVTQPAGWSVTQFGNPAPGVVTFGAPPAAGQAITADFSFYFPCRFNNPKMSFRNFMKALYSADGVQFSSEK